MRSARAPGVSPKCPACRQQPAILASPFHPSRDSPAAKRLAATTVVHTESHCASEVITISLSRPSRMVAATVSHICAVELTSYMMPRPSYPLWGNSSRGPVPLTTKSARREQKQPGCQRVTRRHEARCLGGQEPWSVRNDGLDLTVQFTARPGAESSPTPSNVIWAVMVGIITDLAGRTAGVRRPPEATMADHGSGKLGAGIARRGRRRGNAATARAAPARDYFGPRGGRLRQRLLTETAAVPRSGPGPGRQRVRAHVPWCTGATLGPAERRGDRLPTLRPIQRGRCQSDSWEARSTTWWYSVMIRVGEMLEGKDRTRPVARPMTQNDPPRTGCSLIQSSRTNQPASNSSRCQPRPSAAVGGPMTSVAMLWAASLVITARGWSR